MRIFKLENTVQRYVWGSATGLEATLGIPNPGGKPAAELWMGAHPGAPSVALTESGGFRLDELIAADPEGSLGARVASGFGPALPFLFKGLSAGAPLSIQTHPDKATAVAGFVRENLAGIPLGSPERTYRDDNHKPEMTVALTAFEGLCGFREPAEIRRNLALVPGARSAEKYGLVTTFVPDGTTVPDSDARLASGSGGGSAGFLRSLVAKLLGLSGAEKAGLLAACENEVTALLAAWKTGAEGPAGLMASEREAFRWVARLLELYPGDSGALMPLVLNHIVMRPGEAIFIGSGVMHAYLSGTALEIMANSDNVIRGGLTPKHIDLAELLHVVDFVPERPGLETATSPALAAAGSAEPGTPASKRFRDDWTGSPRTGEETWPIHSPEFCLSRIVLAPNPEEGGTPARFFELLPDGPEILLCSQGSVLIGEGGGALELARGESAFLRADSGLCRIEGEGCLFRARVPGRSELELARKTPPEIRA